MNYTIDLGNSMVISVQRFDRMEEWKFPNDLEGHTTVFSRSVTGRCACDERATATPLIRERCATVASNVQSASASPRVLNGTGVMCQVKIGRCIKWCEPSIADATRDVAGLKMMKRRRTGVSSIAILLSGVG